MAMAFPSNERDTSVAGLKQMSFSCVVDEYKNAENVRQRCSILEESSHRRDLTLPTTHFAVITVEDDSDINDLMAKQQCSVLLQVSSHSGNREVLKLNEPLLMEGCGHYLVSPRLFAIDETKKTLFVLESRVERSLGRSQSWSKKTLLKETSVVSLRRFHLTFDQRGMVSAVEELDQQLIPPGNKFSGVKAATKESNLPIHPVRLLISPCFGELRVVLNRCAGYHRAVTKEKKGEAASACSLLMYKITGDQSNWHMICPLLRNRVLPKMVPLLYTTKSDNIETVIVYGDYLCIKHPSLRPFPVDGKMMDPSDGARIIKIVQIVEQGLEYSRKFRILDGTFPYNIIGVRTDTLICHRKGSALPQQTRSATCSTFVIGNYWLHAELDQLPWSKELKSNQKLELHMKSVWLVTETNNKWLVIKAPLRMFPTSRHRCEYDRSLKI